MRIGRKWGVTWLAACAIAELGGIALAAIWWVAIDRLSPEPVGVLPVALTLLAKAASGIVEGLVLGLTQGRLLRDRLPALPLGRFVAMTMAVAVLGWAIGSAVPMLMAPDAASIEPPPEPTLATLAGFTAVSGLAAGLLFGGAQWIALRRAALGAGRWIVANALGWALALPTIYIAASYGDPDTAMLNALLHGLAGGVVAGALIGGATLWAIAGMQARSA